MTRPFCCEICSVEKKNACPMLNFHEKYCYDCVGDLRASSLLKLRAPSETAFCPGKDNKDLDGIDFVRKCIFEEGEGMRDMIRQSLEIEFAPKLTRLYKLRNLAGRVFGHNGILMLAEIMQRVSR